MEQQYAKQLVLRYGIFFPAGDAPDIIRLLCARYPGIIDSVITTSDSNLVFSYDSDKTPIYAMIFVEKLTTSTSLANDSDSLSIDFHENDLTLTRSVYPSACSIIDDIHHIITPISTKLRVGWRAHVCTWKIDHEIQRTATHSRAVGESDAHVIATVPKPIKVSKAHRYSLTGGKHTVTIARKK
jgi:hypothetical protein